MRKLYLSLFILILSFPLNIFGQKDNTNHSIAIVYIGNSITAGALHKNPQQTAPPIITTALLDKKIKGDVIGYNCGVSGATTYDFLPSHNRYFPKVKESVVKAIQNQKQIIVSIMLGTNDSACTTTTGAPVSNDNYKKNLLTIIQAIKDLAPNAMFVLQRPIWYSPNTYNGARYLKEGLERMKGYTPILHQIAKEEENVFMGDEEGFDYFAEHYEKYLCPEDGFAGTFYLHPTEKGAVRLARFWMKSIYNIFK